MLALIDDMDHVLRTPRNTDEWLAYHAIPRRVLFENRGEFGVYDENHPDEFERKHHPMVLIHKDVTIGVIRVDIRDRTAWFRRVAVREDSQKSGHGRVLLRLAETFAREKGCDEVRSNVAADAVGFYERCGYSKDLTALGEGESIPMLKRLV